MGGQQEVGGLFLALLLCDAGQTIEASCSWLNQLSVFCLLYPTLGIASHVSSSEVLDLGRAGGEKFVVLYTSVSVHIGNSTLKGGN